MQITSFTDANKLLEQFVPRPYKSAEVYSLENITKLMHFLGDPQDELKIIHVAGTSGKTSTAYYCAGLLTAAGHKVGLTVSPHVDEINERVQVNLVPLAEKQFCQALGEFMELAQKSTVKATYYELMVAFVYWEFARQKVDYAVIEVGLGGLLDGTNVAGRPDKVCVITDIGLDHTQVLGNSLAEIATQKAGIIHPENQVFMYEQSPEVMEAVGRSTQENQGILHVLGQRGLLDQTIDLPLFQHRNLELALNAVTFTLWRDKQPQLTLEQIKKAAQTYIPARMETITLPSGQLLIMDGAHNGQKLATLMESLLVKYPSKSIAALMAFVAAGESRWQQGLDAVLPAASSLIITEFDAGQDTPRPSIPAETIKAYVQTHNFETVDVITDPPAALAQLYKSSADILLVAGSFYLLNSLRPHILKG